MKIRILALCAILLVGMVPVIYADGMSYTNQYYWSIYYGESKVSPWWFDIIGKWCFQKTVTFEPDGNIINKNGNPIGVWWENLYPNFSIDLDGSESFYGSMKFITSPSRIICGIGERYINGNLKTIKIIMVRAYKNE